MQTKTAIFHLQETILSKKKNNVLSNIKYMYIYLYLHEIYYAILRLINLNSNIIYILFYLKL